MEISQLLVISELISGEHRFLLVRLHMEALEAAKFSRHVRDELGALRSTIDDIYDDILRLIEHQGELERNLAV